jgi:hypothetical protein
MTTHITKPVVVAPSYPTHIKTKTRDCVDYRVYYNS